MLSKSRGRPFLILALLACLSCSNEGEKIKKHPEDRRIGLEWAKNEDQVAEALSGKRYLTEDFMNACGFFQKLTGITISGDLTPFGYIPTQQSRADFARIKKWYAKNRDKLCWDEGSSTVKLCKENLRQRASSAGKSRWAMNAAIR